MESFRSLDAFAALLRMEHAMRLARGLQRGAKTGVPVSSEMVCPECRKIIPTSRGRQDHAFHVHGIGEPYVVEKRHKMVTLTEGPPGEFRPGPQARTPAPPKKRPQYSRPSRRKKRYWPTVQRISA